MATAFRYEESSEALVVTVDFSRSAIEIVLAAMFSGVFLYFLALHFNLRPLLSILTGMAAALLSALWRARPAHVITTFSKLEAHLQDNLKNTVLPDRHVPLASITYLEFREQSGGGEEAERPSGLYAEVARGSACLVPYIDRAQTEMLIEILYKRFGHILGSASVGPTGFSEGDILSLHLK